jgi:hypothetical protein
MEVLGEKERKRVKRICKVIIAKDYQNLKKRHEYKDP